MFLWQCRNLDCCFEQRREHARSITLLLLHKAIVLAFSPPSRTVRARFKIAHSMPFFVVVCRANSNGTTPLCAARCRKEHPNSWTPNSLAHFVDQQNFYGQFCSLWQRSCLTRLARELKLLSLAIYAHIAGSLMPHLYVPWQVCVLDRRPFV